MNASRTLKLVIVAAVTVMTGLGIAEIAVPGSVVTKAEARVGRPLTPCSVAGVARRTTRRCAAGVYNC